MLINNIGIYFRKRKHYVLLIIMIMKIYIHANAIICKLRDIYAMHLLYQTSIRSSETHIREQSTPSVSHFE